MSLRENSREDKHQITTSESYNTLKIPFKE